MHQQVYVPVIWRGDYASPVDALMALGIDAQDASKMLAGAPRDGIRPLVLRSSPDDGVALIITPEGLPMVFDLYLSMRTQSQISAHRASIALFSKQEHSERAGLIACDEAGLMAICPPGSTTWH